jgi:PPK2 family polyphosphate:nucleotide phosphotransferase
MADGKRLHRIDPGWKVDLAAIDPADTSAAPGDKDATKDATEPLVSRLAELQEILWARRRETVLVVLQGIDTSGKGGTVEHVFGAVNPAGLQVTSFKAPSENELARDYLWRVHANVPADGEIGVFDRSHYESVLAERVLELVPEERWRRRYDHINAFEQLLVDEGTTIVKLLLHISKDEQKRRLEARLTTPEKQWKFQIGDLDARAQWDDYQAAFAEAVERTSTEPAPWHVIPGDKKWYRNWAVATILVATLEAMDLTWPEPEADLSGVVIE